MRRRGLARTLAATGEPIARSPCVARTRTPTTRTRCDASATPTTLVAQDRLAAARSGCPKRSLRDTPGCPGASRRVAPGVLRTEPPVARTFSISVPERVAPCCQSASHQALLRLPPAWSPSPVTDGFVVGRRTLHKGFPEVFSRSFLMHRSVHNPADVVPRNGAQLTASSTDSSTTEDRRRQTSRRFAAS
jgi:hypothetical protein